jgi:hypothetical protein
VALVLAWLVMMWAAGQTDAFTDEDTGLTVRYPQGWLQKADSGMVFQAVDPESGEFKTRYQVRDWPIQETDPITPTLAVVLSNASLSRAQQATAYRLLEIFEGPGVEGLPTMEVSYAYVVEGSDLFVQQMPLVVQGRDVAVAWDGRAHVFTLLAAQDSFEDAGPAFERFLRSAVKDSVVR